MSHSDFRSNHSWFKQLFESSPDPSWIIDDNRFVECNEAAIRTLGYTSREEFLNVHPSKLSPPSQPDGQDSYAKAERMMAIARDKGLHRFEWIHTKADGTNFLAEVTLSTVEMAGRQVIYCVWRDITERKSIEEKLLRQNNTLSAIIENFPGGISLFGADLRLVACNDKFKRLLDLPDALFEKPDVNFEDFICYNVGRGDYGPGDPEQQVAAIVARARNFQQHTIERVRPNGTALEIRGMPLPDGGFVTIYIDVTERKHADLQQRIAATAFESQEGMFITDTSKMILRVNRVFSDITGYTSEEAVGQTPRLLRSGRHDADFYAAMTETIRHDGIWQGEIWNRRKNGEVYPEWLMITAVKDDAGHVTNYVATFTDITLRKLAEDEIRNLAFYDTLTRLPNRRLLNDRLGQTMAASKRSGSYGALMFLDLDNFKPLNDTHGHMVGDLLLIEAADRLKSCVRQMDTVARFGGDEFVVVLSDLGAGKAESTSQAEIVAEKIRIRLSEPYLLTVKREGEAETTVEHRCAVSIGVTLFINHETSQDDILKWADMAMYQAKDAGRNSVRFHGAMLE
jgi:diguanylate cyclase (GGDEF)-like protein/PAS domain S-box-containing protein